MLGEIILVDLDGNVTGFASKMEAHEQGLLHKAFSVFLVDGDIMLVQKRSMSKYHSGGLITNSCCSHPRDGEKTIDAAHRRVREELGITQKLALTEIGEIVYYHNFGNGIKEFEKDRIFVGTYRGELLPNAEEMDEVLWVKINFLKEDIVNNPQKYSCWFITALPIVLKYLKK